MTIKLTARKHTAGMPRTGSKTKARSDQTFAGRQAAGSRVKPRLSQGSRGRRSAGKGASARKGRSGSAALRRQRRKRMLVLKGRGSSVSVRPSRLAQEPALPGRRRQAGLSEAYASGRSAGFAARSAEIHGESAGAGVHPQGQGQLAPPQPAEPVHVQPLQAFRRSLAEWFGLRSAKRPSFRDALALGLAFREGYARAAGLSPAALGVPVPLQGKATVVITACNEERTLGPLLDELDRLPLHERIVVLNGCTDGSFAEVKKRDNVVIAYDPERLGHDVGRSIGAALASGDSLLFMDGDMQVPAEELAAFLYERESGNDVVLNDISAFLPPFGRQDEVTRCKVFLNQALGRPDLGSSSLTAVPHVLSRRALEAIGTAALAVPPKAQAIAILEGLVVSAPCTAEVIQRNRLREGNSGTGNQVAQLIVGDHAEALNEAVRRLGPRLYWQSMPRQELAKARNG
ncbi:glycosyltransferase family 2 protein [Paenibacillus yonginensis]|uniref:glycosyltransferase family 2 protein n=1 Tax=Paenibacillus yonginensis TaxID=1462996 RepID=UPI001246807E|nr:glycosyltransferase [Paenibacillus yonginensis]